MAVKTKLIKAIKQLEMDNTRKKRLCDAIKQCKEPIAVSRLTEFFTLLDLDQALQHGGQEKNNHVNHNFQAIVQLYYELDLDKVNESLNNKEINVFRTAAENLIAFYQSSTLKPATNSRRSKKT